MSGILDSHSIREILKLLVRYSESRLENYFSIQRARGVIRVGRPFS
jgi:hypothetical protein